MTNLLFFSEIPAEDIAALARDTNYMNSMSESEAETFHLRLKGLYRFLLQHPALMQRRLLKGSLLPDGYKEVGVRNIRISLNLLRYCRKLLLSG